MTHQWCCVFNITFYIIPAQGEYFYIIFLNIYTYIYIYEGYSNFRDSRGKLPDVNSINKYAKKTSFWLKQTAV